MRRIAPLFILAAGALLAPSISRAQDVAIAEQSPAAFVETASASASSGPTLDGATVGIRHASEQRVTNAANVGAAVHHGDQATALMIVGGAAFVAGALINGDAGTIVMVGGAAVGLYGLYLYLQ
jgi:hypothetical protein